MMEVRLAMPFDKEQYLDLAEMQVEETLPHLDFRRDLLAGVFDSGVEGARPTIFVCEHKGEMIGHTMCLMEEYSFTSGVFAVLEVLYVRPDKRGTRASVKLIKEFVQWSEIIGAREMIFGIANNFQPERTARLFNKLTGAETVGVYMKKVV